MTVYKHYQKQFFDFFKIPNNNDKFKFPNFDSKLPSVLTLPWFLRILGPIKMYKYPMKLMRK